MKCICFVCDLYVFYGCVLSVGPGVQIGVHHILPRRPAEDARQEDMRGFPRDAVPLPRGARGPPRDGHGGYDTH